MMTDRSAEDFFQPIGAAIQTLDAGAEDVESEAQVIDHIESLCMNCEEQGTTRLFLTRIPFFKEVVLMSFECPHCGYRNSEIQSVIRLPTSRCFFFFFSLNFINLPPYT